MNPPLLGRYVGLLHYKTRFFYHWLYGRGVLEFYL